MLREPRWLRGSFDRPLDPSGNADVEGVSMSFLDSSLFTAWGYQVSTLEATAALTSVIGVGLGVTAKRITWPWWALSSALYGVFFYRSDLFASALLQIVFIIAAIWGWFGWGPKGAQPSALATRARLFLTLGVLGGTTLATPVLSSWGAAATWSDAFLFFGSLVAQIVMVYQKYENWTIWLVVDLVGTIQYAVLGYWFTAALYLIFTIIAALGWSRWYASHRSALRSL